MNGVIRTGMAVLLVFCAACGESGGSAKPLEGLLPTEALGFTEDTTKGEIGVETATSTKEASDLVNGAIDKFDEVGGWKKLAIEHYKKDATTIDLWVVEMVDATKAQAAYVAMSTYYDNNTPWVSVSLGGDQSHIYKNYEDNWYLQAQKGVYFVETTTAPSEISGQTVNEQTAKDFATAVLAKLPK